MSGDAIIANGGGEATAGPCTNCTYPLSGPYCARCGQPTKTRRRALHHLAEDFIEEVVGFESRTLRTARALLLRPGELPAAFREHRTQPYVSAVKLYFFVSLVFFLLLGFGNIAILQVRVTATPVPVTWKDGKAYIPNPAYDPPKGTSASTDDDPDIAAITNPLIPIPAERALAPGGVFNYSTDLHYFSPLGAYRSAMPKAARDHLLLGEFSDSKNRTDRRFAEWIRDHINGFMARIAADPAALNEPLTNWIPRAVFLLLPLYALLLALFHIRRRKDYYFVDHLVFSLSVHTFTFVVLIGAVAATQLIDGEIVLWGVFAAIAVYILLAMKRFYAQGWIRTAIKFIAISGIYFVFFLVPALLVVLFLSAFGGSSG